VTRLAPKGLPPQARYGSLVLMPLYFVPVSAARRSVHGERVGSDDIDRELTEDATAREPPGNHGNHPNHPSGATPFQGRAMLLLGDEPIERTLLFSVGLARRGGWRSNRDATAEQRGLESAVAMLFD